MRYGRYKNELDYSYALGMAPVIELINRCPERVLAIYAHPGYRAESGESIFSICEKNGLKCDINQKIFNIAAAKENTYVIGVFRKEWAQLAHGRPHVVFVNPGDAGNLGSNMRTCLGFGFRDVAIINPGADALSPRSVRASMGAAFHITFAGYDSFDEYAAAFPEYSKYFFSPDGEMELDAAAAIINGSAAPDFDDVAAAIINGSAAASICGGRYSLIFGNEATGLPKDLLRYGRGVRIAHSGDIDSLNLSVAVGIAANAFYKLPGFNHDKI